MKNLAPEKLRLDVLPLETLAAFRICATIGFLRSGGWYLAGGTALAIQVGHRASVDLDFFTTERTLSIADLERKLAAAGEWKTTLSDEGTLHGTLNTAKVSFIAYPFFHPSPEATQYDAIRILSPDDIAVMKVMAVSQRGKKRDFADLYWYTAVHGAQLSALIMRVLEQYPHDLNLPHLLKSLTWFADAEDDVMPSLFFDADWNRIKEYFRTETPGVARFLLKLE